MNIITVFASIINMPFLLPSLVAMALLVFVSLSKKTHGIEGDFGKAFTGLCFIMSLFFMLGAI